MLVASSMVYFYKYTSTTHNSLIEKIQHVKHCGAGSVYTIVKYIKKSLFKRCIVSTRVSI